MPHGPPIGEMPDGERTAQIPCAPQMRWWGWGDPRAAPSLSAAALGYLSERLRLDGELLPPVALANVEVGPSALPAAAAQELRRALGAGGFSDERLARILHAGGKGYLDLVRMRRGAPEASPDVVLLPGDEAQLRSALAVCARHDVAVVPFGGGTSVVGGLAPIAGAHSAVASIDLARLRGAHVDGESRTVTAGAGLRVAELEAALKKQGLTLGHFPQSYEHVTIGGCAATRSAGQASSGYGRFEDLVAGLRLIAPSGTIECRSLPASAAGPDLRQLILGSEGTLGVISAVTLRLHAAPDAALYDGYVFEDFEAGVATLRRLAQDGPRPTVARLSDALETEISLRLAAGGGVAHRLGDAYIRARSGAGRCLTILGFEGGEREAQTARACAKSLARSNGALSLGQRGGSAWLGSRFAAPYLRDELMSNGVLVETLETAGSWSTLLALKRAVAEAIDAALTRCGTPPLVGCHISHLYGDGASLYFTFLARALRGGQESQWRAAKEAACEAILAGGGTISHHHGVGRDHEPWLARELGERGLQSLRALKRELDPHGIMNPGKLISSR